MYAAYKHRHEKEEAGATRGAPKRHHENEEQQDHRSVQNVQMHEAGKKEVDQHPLLPLPLRPALPPQKEAPA